ncbi:MAG: histidine phosphatase family protein [Cytophagales bacterium]|nr:histidine phosphatase family protein [Cytophagales bacterium]
MMGKKIYIIRHGETDYNKKGIVQGSGVDAPLNEKGHEQARLFFETYKHVPFDRVYTSTLYRSVQTVQDFANFGINSEKHDGLKEIDWGDKEGTKITAEDDQYYQKITSEWKNGNLEMKIEGGESPLEVQERQKSVLELIKSRKDEKNILICMHGRAMRIFLCLLLKHDLRKMDDFMHQNLSLYLLDYDDTIFTLRQKNDVSHLT